MERLKAALRSVIIACAKGGRGGLSLFGLFLEKFGGYASFITVELRQQARFGQPPPFQGETDLPPPDELVFDVGSNNGDDAAYYLRKGFRVVAIEASPTLAQALRSRYTSEIAAGKIEVLNVAVIDDDRTELEFFVNDDNDKISTAIAPRDNASFRPVRVQSETLSGLVHQFGVP